MNDTKSFYAGLSPFYHLIYPDWEESLLRQASHLDSVIREFWGSDCCSILDASCGIGTQSLGLAKLGYDVKGSDLSPEEVERARQEAKERSLEIDFHVCDMRHVFDHFSRQFDVVISCDNSVPHLLNDEEIRQTFEQFWRCTRPGGGCIISVRDYEKEDCSQRQVKPYGIRDHDGTRWLLSQVWEPNKSTYDVSMYLIEDQGGNDCRTHIFRATYYPIPIARLIELLKEVGFQDVERLDDRFFQPMIVGTKKEQKDGRDQ
jgi:2-polyprenyl-3-methyl-5-hydroxy-6-metoxy-1,4-benzoquinol methylase